MPISAILLAAAIAGAMPSPARPAASATPAARAPIRFDKGRSARNIPIEIAGEGLAFVKGKVQDADVWFLLDTGSACVLSQKVAEKLGLSAPAGSAVSGAEESRPARLLPAVPVRLPGVAVTLASVSSFDLDPAQMTLGHRVDGILGASFFESLVVELDYARATVAFSDPRAYRFAGRAAAIPLKLEAGYPYAEGSLALARKPPISGSFLIDTGVDNAVILFSPFVTSHGLLGVDPTITPDAGPRPGGGNLEAMVRAENLELGPFRFREPVVQLSRSTQGLLADGNHAGLIGGSVLARFRVTLDLPHRRLWLQKNRRYEEPFLHDASGLSLVALGPDLATFLIRRVSPASPGAQAGLIAGDVLLAVDGKPARDVGLRGVRRLLQLEGHKYVLTVIREGEIKKLTIECRRQL
ncbi:MAG TPA: aspartyl protease family protein [Thermoanaerobaculia bacterium]|nr:aspartyl protease family protein [Thermoanaerobaculia bacterium]